MRAACTGLPGPCHPVAGRHDTAGGGCGGRAAVLQRRGVLALVGAGITSEPFGHLIASVNGGPAQCARPQSSEPFELDKFIAFKSYGPPGRREHVLDGQQAGLSNEQRHGLGSRQGIVGFQEAIVELHAFIVDFEGWSMPFQRPKTCQAATTRRCSHPQ